MSENTPQTAEDQSSGPARQNATRALGTCEEDDRRGMESVQGRMRFLSETDDFTGDSMEVDVFGTNRDSQIL